jgi:hypothetical protein
LFLPEIKLRQDWSKGKATQARVLGPQNIKNLSREKTLS